MLKYALDYTNCRKLLFDSYFGNPASVVAPYSVSDRSPCGHCDNCLRKTSSPTLDSSILIRDATMDAWKVCKIIKAMEGQAGKVTMQQASDLVRGLGKGAFQTKEKGMKGAIDLQQVCGGKVTLSKDVSKLVALIGVQKD